MSTKTIKRFERFFYNVLAFLFFLVLPFGQLPYVFFRSGGVPILLAPWREIIVFLMPLMAWVFFRLRPPRTTVMLVSSAILLLLVPLSFSAFSHSLPLFQLVIGLITYFSVIWLFVFFMSIRLQVLLGMLPFLKYSMIIGGAGLFADYLSGYAISRYLEMSGIDRVSTQTTIVARSLFLYTATTEAASLLSVLVVIVVMIIPTLKASLPGEDSATYDWSWTTRAALFFAVLGITVTYSRVGLVALFLVAIYFIFFSFNIKVVLAAASICLISFASLSLLLDEASTDYLQDRAGTLYKSSEFEQLDGGRTDSWAKGIDDFFEHPFAGRGIGTGNTRAAQFFTVRHYESTPLWVGNEAGLFGMLVFFLPYIATVIFFVRMRNKSTKLLKLLYSMGCIFFVVTVNPGGSSFVLIALMCLVSAIAYRSLRQQNAFVSNR